MDGESRQTLLLNIWLIQDLCECAPLLDKRSVVQNLLGTGGLQVQMKGHVWLS